MASNFIRPTLAQLIDRVQTDLEGALVGVNARLRRTVEFVLARALAGLAHGQHGHLAWVAEQILPDQAAERFLLRWADLFGVDRKEGTFAEGQVTVTGTGGTVAVGTTWVRPADGATFETIVEPGPITGAEEITVRSTVVGLDFNMDDGQTLSLEAPIVDISSDAFVGPGDIGGGSDLETLEALLERLLAKIRKPPLGGAPGDHVIWALEVPGVTRAWEYAGTDGEGNPGIGKVSLAFVRDGDIDIIPSPAEVQEVQDYVQANSPAEVITFAPTPIAYDTTIQLLPNTTAVQGNVDAELADMLLREAEPGGEVLWSLANEAISLAEGEEDHVLVSPAANKSHNFGELAVAGVNTYLPIP